MQRCVKEELTDCVANDDDRSKANKELDDEGCKKQYCVFNNDTISDVLKYSKFAKLIIISKCLNI